MKALRDIIGEPLLTLVWEIDDECSQVVKHHFPKVQHRGDFLLDDPKEVATMVRRHDEHQCCRILVLGAPPCPDFSVIKEDSPGLKGEEGSKFPKFVQFLQSLEHELSDWTFDLLCENVVMQKADEVQYVSNGLKAQPIVVDAADLGLVNRPRLWWMRVDWRQIRKNPSTDKNFRWGSTHKMPRLYMDFPWIEQSDLAMEGLAFPPRVAKHECRMPCMTAPAPSADGRPPPKKMKSKMRPDTRQRWLEDSRQYAPWHYDEEHMLVDTSGQLTLPTIGIKEQLQGLPIGYTAVGDLPVRSRHRMMGNAWNCTVAKFLLTIILILGQSDGTHSMQTIPLPPRQSALQMVTVWAQREPHGMGPIEPRHSDLAMAPTSDMWDHWRTAHGLVHPLLQKPCIELGVQQVFDKWQAFGGDIPRLRREVVEEVHMLVDEMADQTATWFAQLPDHIQRVYSRQGSGEITQVPALVHLLEQCGFPDLPTLATDLSQGFALTGPQNPGPGWVARQDERYSHPITFQAFRSLNHQYIQQKMARRPIDPHWTTLLEELLKEKAAGRLSGPHRTPPGWKSETVGLEGHPTTDLPTSDVLAAVCFSVVQSDKIRRCEDFRRSFHNSTLSAGDVPTHHTIDSYVHLCRHYGHHDQASELWTHDLASAYRQFPVKDRSVAYTILFTPSGPTLWCHGALCFGASASVWAFNRCADMIQFTARKLLLLPVHHFVDDFAAAEPPQLAMTGFNCFRDLFDIIGMQMKPTKACAPKPCQKLLGVNMIIEKEQLTLQVCSDRLSRLLQQIQTILHSNALSPMEAQRLAGKLVFLQTTTFGNVGRALTYPLYARAQGHGQDPDHDRLNTPLRETLHTLQYVLRDLQPRIVPLKTVTSKAVLYTDAFFALGDRSFRPSDKDIPTSWNPQHTRFLHNGWGFVLSTGPSVFAAHGVAPAKLIDRFCSRRAFIYFLELLAPTIAMCLFASQVDPYLIAFVDNTASLAALNKGYGRDISVNRMLAFLWCLIARSGLYPHFTWVQSSHNISDSVSRHDLSAARAQGWTILEVEFDELYNIIGRCADDMRYACTQAVDEAILWSSVVAKR